LISLTGLILLFLIGVGRAPLSAQSPAWLGLYGQTGIAVTPTAYLLADRHLVTGWQHIPAAFAHLRDSRRRGVGEQVFFASIGFLPFAETSIRLVHPDKLKGKYGIGDRSLFLKVGLFKETAKRPAIALGIYDPIGTRLLPATYVVASKSFALLPYHHLMLTTGYGADFPKNEDYLVRGWWVGGQIASAGPPSKWWPRYMAGAEYHRGQFNLSAGLHAFSFLQVNAWLLDFNHFAFGLSGSIRL
jgi:hypothetical protein